MNSDTDAIGQPGPNNLVGGTPGVSAPAAQAGVLDAGPWSLLYGGNQQLVGVQSDDFEHAALLRVSGDFGTSGDKRAYLEWLCDVLNREAALGAAPSGVCYRALQNCYKEFTEIREAVLPAINLLQGYIDLLDAYLATEREQTGISGDSPFHEDRRILVEAVGSLGGLVQRTKAAVAGGGAANINQSRAA